MARTTRCKNIKKGMLTKDPNFNIFLDTSGRITETYQIDWPKIYSIFYNDDLSNIQNHQSTYHKIRDSGLHAIASRPSILPYTDPLKWIMDHTNPKDQSFNDSVGSQLATFCPDVFTRTYALKSACNPSMLSSPNPLRPGTILMKC